MKFQIIAAIDSDGLIGIKDCGKYGLPWPFLSKEMNYFKEQTISPFPYKNAIIMGYRTWITMQSAYLKEDSRINIVISCSPIESVLTAKTFTKALSLANSLQSLNKIFVIGGSTIYSEAIVHPDLSSLYITQINHSYPKTISLEEKIYFPLLPSDINYHLKESSMIITNRSGIIMDLSKNISFEFFIYDICLSFRKNYKSRQTREFPSITIKSSPVLVTAETQYIELIKKIISTNSLRENRNSPTLSIFGHQLRFDLSQGFPLSTIKRSYPKAIFEELMWFIRGQTNVKILRKTGTKIWDKNSTKEFLLKQNLNLEEDDIGPSYGFQMRYRGATYINCNTNYKNQGFDQLANLINQLKTDRNSRRMIIDLWDPLTINQQALPPCAFLYNFSIDSGDSDSRLNCHLFQRSWDVLLGWNTSTAALFTLLLAKHCDLEPGVLIHSVSDAHLYKIHIDSGAIDELLSRDPRPMPQLRILNKRENIEEYIFSDVQIESYYPNPGITIDMVA